LSAADTLDGIWSDLREWTGGDLEHDDVTVVVLCVPKTGPEVNGEWLAGHARAEGCE
jgi:hypothetical protein